jgi:hypothetical protein
MLIIRITEQNQEYNKVDKISLEQSYYGTDPKIQDGTGPRLAEAMHTCVCVCVCFIL